MEQTLQNLLVVQLHNHVAWSKKLLMTNAHRVKTDQSPTCFLCFDTTNITFLWTRREQALPLQMTATWFLGLTNSLKCYLLLWSSSVCGCFYFTHYFSVCTHMHAHTLANNSQLFLQYEANLMQMYNSFKSASKKWQITLNTHKTVNTCWEATPLYLQTSLSEAVLCMGCFQS